MFGAPDAGQYSWTPVTDPHAGTVTASGTDAISKAPTYDNCTCSTENNRENEMAGTQ